MTKFEGAKIHFLSDVFVAVVVVVAKKNGQDLDNRGAHPHQEIPKSTPGASSSRLH